MQTTCFMQTEQMDVIKLGTGRAPDHSSDRKSVKRRASLASGICRETTEVVGDICCKYERGLIQML